MRLIVELSQEHPTLPASEVLGAARALGAVRPVTRDEGLLVLDGEGFEPAALARRVAMAHAIDLAWDVDLADAAALVRAAHSRRLDGSSFAVRAKRIGDGQTEIDSSALVREIGGILAASGRVDLVRPEREIRILLARRLHWGERASEVDRTGYEDRHVRHRPMFSPIAIHPRQARALVNLASLKAGERALDPFAGTGGLALEAALVGARVFASDLDERMVAGTRELFRARGIAAAVEARDVAEAPAFSGKVDVVLSDPPYGRASTTMREGIEKLYARFLDAVDEALVPGGRLAVVFPGERWVKLAAEKFELVEEHPVRVHRSLTRHFCVFRQRD